MATALLQLHVGQEWAGSSEGRGMIQWCMTALVAAELLLGTNGLENDPAKQAGKNNEKV